jgi:hypothetical protein
MKVNNMDQTEEDLEAPNKDNSKTQIIDNKLFLQMS